MRRLIAMFIDSLVIILYALTLYYVNTRWFLGQEAQNELIDNLIGFIAMIVPVAIYFYLMEMTYHGSIGKLLCRLQVISTGSNRSPSKILLIRTILFILPWIAGHAFVYRGFYSNWTEGVGLLIWGIITYGLLFINYGMMIARKDHRGFHELLSQTHVIKKS